MMSAVKPGSATGRTRPYRQSAFSILVVGAFLSGGMTITADATGADKAAAQITFEQYEVVIGPAPRQTVLTGFLLGGAIADLALLNIDDNDDRRLRIFSFGDSTWVPELDAVLGPDLLFVDVANIGGQDRLLTYQRGRLNWFDPESATERALVAATSNFIPPAKGEPPPNGERHHQGEIPHVDITRDLNNDGRDDLVLPDVDGFWVFIQMSDGALADPVKIGPATELAGIYGADGYRYDPWSQSRVHEMDYNQDGRGDLVFWNQDHFEVHLQNEHGLFAPEAVTFTIAVAFDSDELSWLATGDMVGRVLHSLTDLSGDGVADLVVFSLAGKSISNKRSAFEAHLGAPTAAGGIAFAPDVEFAIQSDDIQVGMDRLDSGRDGRNDLMVTTIDVEYLESSPWKSLKGFMGDDIWLDLEFYRMQRGRYPDKPGARHRILLDGMPSPREPGWVPLDVVLRGGTHESRKTRECYLRAFNRTLLIGDVTGDGRSDLLLGSTDVELHVFVGAPGPELFAPEPQKVAVAIPHDEEYTWLVDLNNDGVQDVLMHHHSTEPRRLTMLVAR